MNVAINCRIPGYRSVSMGSLVGEQLGGIDLRHVRRDAWKIVSSVEADLSVDGFSLWNAHKFEIYHVLVKVLRDIQVIEAISELGPSKVVYQPVDNPDYTVRTMDYIPGILSQASQKHGFELILRKGRKNLKGLVLPLAAKARSLQRKKMKSSLDKADILFFHYGTPSVDLTDDLYWSIKEDGHKPMYVCRDGVVRNSLYDYCTKNKIDFTYLEPYEIPGRYDVDWKKIQLSHGDYDLSGIISPALERLFEAPDNMRIYHAMRSLIQQVKPKAGILTNDNGFYGIAAAAALEAEGVDCYSLSKGPMPDRFACSESPAKKLFVWGPLEKQRKIESGIPREKIVVVGTNKYGEKKPRISHRKKNIVFACRRSVLDDLRNIRHVNDTFREPGINIVIKVHPADFVADVNKLKKIFNADVQKETSFFKLLQTADLVISHGMCKTCLDTIFYGVPLIILDPEPQMDIDYETKINFDEKIAPFTRAVGSIDKKEAMKKLNDDYFNDVSRRSEEYFSRYYKRLDMDKIKSILYCGLS